MLISRLREGAHPGLNPLLSIVVPARNESASIGQTIAALTRQSYRNLEIIVVNDQSTDDTAGIVRAIASTDARVTLIDGQPTPEGWLGKPWALHQGSDRARGALLLFVDADILYAPGAVAAGLAFQEERGAQMVSFFPELELRGFWENVLLTQLVMIVFVLFPSWLSNLTTKESLGIGGGTGNLITRQAYDRIGGHAALRRAIVDDVGLSRLARRHGFGSLVVRADGLIRLRIYDGLRAIVTGFEKNTSAVFGNSIVAVAVVCALTAVFHLWPFALSIVAVSQWLTDAPVSVVARLGLVTVGVITILRLVVFSSLGYSILTAIFAYPLSLAVWMFIIARSAVVTRGRSVSWRGRTFRGGSAFGD